MTTCPQDYIAKNYALTSQQHTELLTFKHNFSHFHLYIKALALKTTSKKMCWPNARETGLPQLSLINSGLPNQLATSLIIFFGQA
ncbi:hypothetical protein [Legionella tunisiensis]|uniref:hypothetical protein n=1 Tax=Legionella tunisiensis TaxID=1034944 RepID=UPI001E45CA54|nr:hypothetical protein [Legionella tunisiensis]